MSEQDLLLLHDGLQQPHIVERWGGEAQRATLAETRERHHPRPPAGEQDDRHA
jgi:hypothetical protein